MQVDMGVEPLDKQRTFTVEANIYSELANCYIAHWDGGTFDNYDSALDYWDDWALPSDEVESIMKKQREKGDYSHHELEIGIYSNDIFELPIMNMELDVGNER